MTYAQNEQMRWRDWPLLGLMSAICCSLALTLSSPSSATTLRKLSVEELVSTSSSIIVGRCEKTETLWSDKRIYTIATIRVSQSAKGTDAPGHVIEVRTLGGAVTQPLPVKMLVPGAEVLSVGEDMLLFLEKFGDQRQFNRVVGMAQGKLAISTDPKSGRKSVGIGVPVKGVKWVDPVGKALAPNTADEDAAETDSLERFLGRVQRIQAVQNAKAVRGSGGGK